MDSSNGDSYCSDTVTVNNLKDYLTSRNQIYETLLKINPYHAIYLMHRYSFSNCICNLYLYTYHYD